MNKSIRYLGSVLIVVAVLSAIVASSSVILASERDASVAVADDSSAYLSINDCTVHNEYHTTTTVSITHKDTTERTTLAPGRRTTVDFGNKTIIQVTTGDDSFSTVLTHDFDCDSTEEDSD